MSNIGKQMVAVPSKVSIDIYNIQDFKLIKISGPLGVQSITLPLNFDIKIEKQTLSVLSEKGEKWGTIKRFIDRAITGVSTGFTKTIELVGIGYKAQILEKELILMVGKSHKVIKKIPENIKITCPNETTIKGFSSNYGELSQYMNEILQIKPAYKDVYKGKGMVLVQLSTRSDARGTRTPIIYVWDNRFNL